MSIRLPAKLPALPRPLPFPLGAPTWPTSVQRPKKRSVLGVNYETEWARRYSVRLARVAYTELVTRPLMTTVAQPSDGATEHVGHVRRRIVQDVALEVTLGVARAAGDAAHHADGHRKRRGQVLLEARDGLVDVE